MQRRTPTLFRLLALLFVLALVAGACGGRDDDEDAGGGQEGGDGELATGPGFDGKTIKLGVITPLSGPVADPIGKPLTAGGDVYWQKVNERGGIAGKYPVELVKEDNVYDPAQTRAKYTKIKNDVVLFSQILGTPPTKAVLGELKTDKIVASPASLDAAWVREPNLLPIGTTYQLQFVNAADYLIKEEGFRGKPICIAALEGEYGEAGIEGLNYAAKELGFQVAATVRMKTTDVDATALTAPVQQLQNARCAAVFLTALPQQTGAIIGAGAQKGFTPRWVGQSPTWVSALAKSAVAPALQRSFLWVSEGTTWGDESVPGMKEMIEDQKKYAAAQQPDIYFTFGYAQAKAVAALLESAVENGDLSRDGILKAVEEIDVQFNGLLGDYKYGKVTEREPSRNAVIFKVNPAVPGALEKIKEISSDAGKKFTFK